MASKFFPPSHFSSNRRILLICFLLVSITLMLFALSVKPKGARVTSTLQVEKEIKPAWFDVIEKGINSKRIKIKVGLVNIDKRVDGSIYEQLDALRPQVETVTVDFDHVDENLKWEDFFPNKWINDEDEKRGQTKCRDIPMPIWEDYRDVNVVVAKVPCGKKGKGILEGVIIRDVFRLQVNLVVANLAVESGWAMNLDAYSTVYVVFIGSCGPMVDIFKCDDLLMHQGDYWVYKPDLGSLKQKTLMPFGSCQIAPGYAETGKEVWRAYMSQSSTTLNQSNTMRVPRLAYVTVLHSTEANVCGAITLAQSILHTEQSMLQYNNYTIHLLLLADNSIGPESIRGLKAAGWKIHRIQRILSPFAKRGSYNQWSYSKLRIWQLANYDKIIFLDSNLLVLKNIDDFFTYPQLSAAPNDNYTLFNSGLMVIEPSMCMFEELMQKSFKVQSDNGSDQGFLNEVFMWWHRLPSKLNYLKSFQQWQGNEKKHEIPEDVYVINYLGLKPWMCYRDYDCNWDMQDHHIFASDSAHQRWWQVYDAMPKELQSYCGLTQELDERITEWRRRARNASLSDGHWKIELKDPRRKHYAD